MRDKSGEQDGAQPVVTDTAQALGVRASAPMTKQGFALIQLRDMITRGDLRPGDWIKADDWARNLAISATPIREALRQLESMGLVTIDPHVGARVRGYSVQEFTDIVRARAALEGVTTELAVKRTAEPKLRVLVADLKAHNRTFAQAMANEDAESILEANREFHWGIYSLADSKELTSVIERLWLLYSFNPLSVVTRALPNTVQEHNRIIQAVAGGDPRAAREAMQSHLESYAVALDEAVKRGELSPMLRVEQTSVGLALHPETGTRVERLP